MEPKYSRTITKGKQTSSRNNRQDSFNRFGNRREAGTSKTTNTTELRQPRYQRNKIIRPQKRAFTKPESTGSLFADDGPTLDVEQNYLQTQNLNYLIDIRTAPRKQHEVVSNHSKQSRPKDKNKPKYNKKQYLYANCRFLIKKLPDSYNDIKNIDTVIEWDQIEQVEFNTYDNIQCPICLFPPIACKMTECGHIYCWSCILHYLSLSEKRSRRCPICYDHITADDLKSTIGRPTTYFKVADKISFQLMKRPANSLKFSRAFTLDESDYFEKLQLADKHKCLLIFDREEKELLEEIQNHGPDSSEIMYLEQAYTILTAKRDALLADDTQYEGDYKSAECSDKYTTQETTADLVYFYQAIDGQHIYLHPLNCKMLEMMYGSFELCPHFIEGTILQKEDYSITESFRRRFKHLQHHSLTSEVTFAEIQFTKPTITEEVELAFESKLRARKVARIKQMKNENKKLQKKKNGNNHGVDYEEPSCSGEKFNLSSKEQFPDCSNIESNSLETVFANKLSFATVAATKTDDTDPFPKIGTTVPGCSSMRQRNDSGMDEHEDQKKYNTSLTYSFSEIFSGAESNLAASRAAHSQKGEEKDASKKGKKGKKGVKLYCSGLAIMENKKS